ncbi:Por secretion system C-terminal sorting domain-containing protein [Flavobacterium gillisiae]|uniref:Por secretion system C-terminal sorting domain-containing protein n=1 Tax=Flavobacterium gillisiae TaxID=150146 RepID=A0A1H4F890_9FLAO|nr:RICIN domain-containing protein [Flavobacterium gillisiae]SEA93556.1 Por secretion system C-terminal sorting domain-containing protein [Flavobacterium gillisiae]
MKLQLLYFRFIFAILYLSSVSADAQVSQNVSVNQNVKYQTIQGWGVSLAWWANLAGGMPQSTIDELAGYAVNDLNLNVFRFNIGGGENPNCTAGDHIRKDGAKMPGYRSQQADGQGWGTYDLTSDVRQISMMDKIAMLRQNKGDIITETISYSPPWWMTYGECSAGNVSATSENLKPEFIDDFADYLVSVTAGLKAAHPLWNISYIEPFNEPMSGYWMKGGLQEGSGIYPATQAQILYRLWQSQSTYNMWSISLGAADNSKVPTTLSNMTTLKTNNPNEYNFLAKINTHSYDGTWQEKVNLSSFAKTNGNKPIWQTETGPLSWNLPSGKTDWQIRHYDMAYRLIEDLRNLQSVVWCDWQLLSSDDGWGLIQQTNWNENNPYQTPVLKKTRGFYCRKNVTNYIKAGYQIIDINNGSSLAALSPDKSEAVMVMVNNSDTTKSYTIDLSSFGYLSGFKTYRTSGFISGTGEDCTEKTVSSATEKGLLSGNTLSYTAPAYSVTTFVVSLLALAPVPNGDYFIKAVHSNKYMTVAGFSSTNGAVIEQYDYSNQDNLKFTVTRDLNGYYKFKPKYTDKIMTVNGGSNSNGTAININNEDTNASNQKFIIEDLGSGQYRVTPKYSLNKALGVSNQGQLNGDDVVLWDYLDAGNFKWEFIPVSAVNSIPNGDYNIKAVHSNKYMTVAGFSSTNGAVIEQYDYSNQDNLKFTVTRDLNGYYKFKPKYTDKIMTVNGGSNSNGTAININTEDTNASNQKFIIEDLGSGQYRVTPKYSLNKALGVSDQGQLNGDDVVLWDYLGTDNFKWTFTSTSSNLKVKNGNDKQILFEDSTLENKNNFNNIKIYPNPSGGLFKISKEGSVPLNLQIFDITGKLLTETVLIKLESELHLDKPLFNQGVYILKFSNERGAFISKIIVK